MSLEEFMKKEGWVQKVYFNCNTPYFAWHKEGFQIDEIDKIDKDRKWSDA